MAILWNVKVIFFCVTPYDWNLYMYMNDNDSIRCKFDFECDCVIGNVTLVSNILNSHF